MSNLLEVSLESLQAHPQNDGLYRDNQNRTEAEIEELRSSLEKHGVWEGQVVIHPSMTILSGHRRVVLAKQLGIETIKASVAAHLPDNVEDPEVLQFLLNANASRQKTNEEKLREFEMRKQVLVALSRRKTNENLELGRKRQTGGGAHLEHTGERSRDVAAKKSGLGSGFRAEKASQALQTADKLRKEGETEKADSIVKEINRSLNAGVKQNRRRSRKGAYSLTVAAQKPVVRRRL